MNNRVLFVIALILILIFGTGYVFYLKYSIFQNTPTWSIGLYRLGKSFEIEEFNNNPVLSIDNILSKTDYFVADPFMYIKEGKYYLFYEKGKQTKSGAGWKGVISYAISEDGIVFKDREVVLEDNISISFPQIFDYENDTFMTISNDGTSKEAKNIRLFKALAFPDKWVCVDTLLTGYWKDPTIIAHNDNYYLFASTPSHDAHLFYSTSLFGSYMEHPRSPIVYNNKKIGRNAGQIISYGGGLYRPVQDCSLVYGEKVRLMEITKLDIKEYEEYEIPQSPILQGSGTGWNKMRMHTLNIYQDVDGDYKIVTDGSEIMGSKRSIRIKRRK